MTTGNVEEAAARLLVAFHELSGGVLTREVPLRDPEGAPNTGAAPKAGLDAGSTLSDVAVRYLLNKGWLQEHQQEPGVDPAYVITPPGVDEARRIRGTDT